MKKTAVVGLPDVLKVFARWLWSFARVNVYFLTSLDIENLIFRRKGLYLPQKLVMTPEEILTLLEEGRGDEIVWAEAETAGADFSGATFEGLDMQGADFSDANLAGATFVDCNLAGATFVGANLDGATFDGCNLDGAD
ncbi:MAG: pentapeptide repeat-containing protein, partial [Bacteroidia bacterium]|nr:pentapeptide repeat-containing protein [Bacteroidia bacterium]